MGVRPNHWREELTSRALPPTAHANTPLCVDVCVCRWGRAGEVGRADETGEGGVVCATRPPSPSLPTPTPSTQSPAIKYDHLLVTLVDASPTSLSDGSRAALAATGCLARDHAGARVTVLLVDAVAPSPDGMAARTAAVGAALEASGVDPGRIDYLERALEEENAAAAVGDAADATGADLLVLSSDAVHAKAVDANLLAEFVDCPVLLLP